MRVNNHRPHFFRFWLLLIIGFNFLGCKIDKEPMLLKEYLSDYSDVVDKEIVFDTTLSLLTNESYTIGNRVTIFTVVGADCGSCIELFEKWNEFLKSDSFFKKLHIVFIAQGRNNELLEGYIRNQSPPFSIYLDSASDFLRRNNLSSSYYKISILLDKANKIKFVGNPLDGEPILTYYRYIIENKL